MNNNFNREQLKKAFRMAEVINKTKIENEEIAAVQVRLIPE